MTTYRSLTTIEAVQFTGEPIEGVTCSGSDAEVQIHGCDSSRKKHLHVHANAVGGMIVLKPGDWIFAVHGGPWGVASDDRFRASWEVKPEPEPARQPVTVDHLAAPSEEKKPWHKKWKPPVASPEPTDFETRHYADGTSASGTGPLPETSPGGAPSVSTISETSVEAGPATE